jgi:hypothetical protein
MSQRQCPWCGKLGVKVRKESELFTMEAMPHADGSPCVCRHITCNTKSAARESHGRYFDKTVKKWMCFGCGNGKAIKEK